jgi:hypothetical protein
MWKTDRLMRPIHVLSYEEQPGCKIKVRLYGLVTPTMQPCDLLLMISPWCRS